MRCWWRSLALVPTLALAACSTPELYDWGAYQAVLAETLLGPGGDPQAQIHLLSVQLEQTEHAGRLVPPGVRAHLAMLKSQAGDADAARSLLVQEKTAFPESAVFVDRLLARLGQ